MAINYVGYIRQRMESLGAAIRDHVDDPPRDDLDPDDVAWLTSVAERISALAAQLETEEPRYQAIDPTAPPH